MISFNISNLILEYKKYFNIDIEKHCSLNNDDKLIYLKYDYKTSLKFYSPSIVGEGSLYQKLSENKWYYTKDRWEFSVVREKINGLKNILEFGAGDGYFLEKLPRLDKYAVEINVDSIEKLKNKGVKVFPNIEEMHSSFKGTQFDAVVSFQVLEHIINPLETLSKLINITKVNGSIFISVPTSESIYFISYFSKKSTYYDDYKKMQLLNMPPHHQSIWSHKTFKKIQKSFKVKIKSVLYEPIRDESKYFIIELLFYKYYKVFPHYLIRKMYSIMSKNIKGHTILVELEKL